MIGNYMHEFMKGMAVFSVEYTYKYRYEKKIFKNKKMFLRRVA